MLNVSLIRENDRWAMRWEICINHI